MSRDWLLYLDDLIDSAEKVQRFLIGEAVKSIPDQAKSAVPEGDWSGPARMRDLIAVTRQPLAARDPRNSRRAMLDVDLARPVCKYPGTLVFVSHDREFVSSLATRILELKPGGEVIDFRGSYEDYLADANVALAAA